MKNLFCLLIILSTLVTSCARVGSPEGGAKDSLAPKFLGSNIDSARVNVPKDIKELRLDFDEYVTLKDISKNLIISPPIKKIKKITPSNLSTKYVLIQWQDTLQSNTTYSFNFGNAITDLNEGNVLPYFTYAFSTGNKIDDLYISGDVKNAMLPTKQTGKPEANKYVVGLYKVQDSMNYNDKPYYISKVDPDGYFELNYLSPGTYQFIAFDDDNQNSIYDAGKESVGFRHDNIVIDSSNISKLEQKLYPSKKKLKFNEIKAETGGLLMTFEGNPDKVDVKLVSGEIKDYKVTHTQRSDSVRIWFNALKDSIALDKSQKIEFSYDANGVKQDTISVFYRANEKDEFSISNAGSNKLPPKSNFAITANWALDNIKTDNWALESDSIAVPFSAKISEKDPYKILVSADFKEGKAYKLTVPSETVSSFYQSNVKAYLFEFEIDKIQNYGSLTLNLTNKPEAPFWAQLLNEKGEVAYAQLSESETVTFTELKPATYNVRILVDNNSNGFWDPAEFPDVFPEDVYLFGKSLIIRPMWENSEKWDLKSNTSIPQTFEDKP